MAGTAASRLFDLTGRTALITGSSQGLGFAIPVAYLKNFLQNRDAFAFDKTNPNSGYHYLEAPRRRNPSPPPEAGAESK